MSKLPSVAALLALTLMSLHSTAAETQALLKQGAYIAIAADCNACHQGTDNAASNFAGGKVINSPAGNISASNITPSKQYGIGNWTEQQLGNALRKGRSAQGHYLYPVMPYTAYQGISDQDLHALYSYLQHGVEPVDHLVDKTRLAFPLNIRAVMAVWNLMFLEQSADALANTEAGEINRGQYLVDHLAHCGTCHTPRNALMAEDDSRYLAGATVGGWFAPNITPDTLSGIGDWSEADLVNYLRTGHLLNQSQAAGPMAEAIEKSFRYLSLSDLHAMAKYLRNVNAIATTSTPRVIRTPAPAAMHMIETGHSDNASLSDASSTNGSRLYNAACASCHGKNGLGSADGFYPSLNQNRALSGQQSNNLVMSIIHGVQRDGFDLAVNMPALGDDLNDAQIAAVANHSLQMFGNSQLSVSADRVKSLRQGGESSLLIKAAPYLVTVLAIVILTALTYAVIATRKRKSQHLKRTV